MRLDWPDRRARNAKSRGKPAILALPAVAGQPLSFQIVAKTPAMSDAAPNRLHISRHYG